jgi:hypothetical protein
VPCPTMGHGARPLIERARESLSNHCSDARFAASCAGVAEAGSPANQGVVRTKF